MNGHFKRFSACLLAAGSVALASLGGCSSSSTSDAVTVQGNFAVVFAKRANSVAGNPTDSVEFAPGGDLMMVNLASPSAPMVNLTTGYTQGQGDVCDPEVSYDGTRVLFSMRGPKDSNFGIFEMILATQALHRINPPAGTAAGDDVDPAYLPDGRIVFASNRQATTQAQLTADNAQTYQYLDEYDREESTVLHVMNADGSDIHQISMNQSHDRNPTVMMDGRIMFARWDHLGARNHFPIFTVNPDGTNLFIEYGAFSPGNSFLHPREMPNGHVLSDLMPLSGTHEGGALMGIDVINFSDDTDPVSPTVTGNAQNELTLDNINFDTREGLAPDGRYTTPYPLWDGTNRALVSWSPSRPVQSTNMQTGQPEQEEGPPAYGVYMFDIGEKTLRPIALPPDGWDYVDPIAVAPRPLPNVIPDATLDADLAAQNLGVINVKSVYDTDGQNLMGQSMLAPGELQPYDEIPQIAAPANDDRSTVADIATIKDPAKTTAAQRPGRFLRVSTAVPTPPGLSRETIGNTELEMQHILGYTVIQPDGSARILVPANTPVTLSVVDSNGLTFQRHTDWLQVRPGETRTCNGCHSPRRGVALNLPPIAGNDPNTLITPNPGESMAETWTRLNPSTVGSIAFSAASLQPDMNFVDVWTDPAMARHQPDPSLNITYAGLTTTIPSAGVIDYPTHIAPIFSASRGTNGADTCTNCHNNTVTTDPNSFGLDLRDQVAGTGRMQSYESLTMGPIQFVNGLPEITFDDNGDEEITRAPAQVASGSSTDSSRSSQFFEEMFGKQIHSNITLPAQTKSHTGMLNPSEIRLLAEWTDLGAQYYNDPYNSDDNKTLGNLRGVVSLDQTVYNNTIHPILMNRCASCHQAFGGNGSSSNNGNDSFTANQFVLTGNLMGDYGVTLTMVTNVCQPAQNPLLERPSWSDTAALPHPSLPGSQPPAPVLPITDKDYTTIFQWIASGQCTT